MRIAGRVAQSRFSRGPPDPLSAAGPLELPPLKLALLAADTTLVEAAERQEILRRYLGHTRRFEAAAAGRPASWPPVAALRWQAEEHRPAPSARELEVLQSVAEGFGNREIGVQLFLAEETIKMHVRRLLAKLQARSRAHAVAVGFRRQLIS